MNCRKDLLLRIQPSQNRREIKAAERTRTMCRIGRYFRAATRVVVGLVCAAGVFSVTAGTVITTNLPSNTAIINIDARADGAARFNGDQSLWYQPFNTGGTLLEYTVSPGTYEFRVINATDAAQMFPGLTTAQTNQMFSGWTYNSPWIENYLVFDSAAATNSSIPQIFDGDPEWPPYSNPNDAYSATVTNGTYNKLRIGPLGRDSTTFVYSYTFADTETLIFVVPDYGLSDNGGGVSVLIAPTTAVVTPLLSITAGPALGAVTLAWTTNAPGFILAQSTNLQAFSWTDVTNVPSILNTNYSVTRPMDATARFFRLHSP